MNDDARNEIRAVTMPDGSVDVWSGWVGEDGSYWERLGALYESDDRWVMRFSTDEPAILDVDDLNTLLQAVEAILRDKGAA